LIKYTGFILKLRSLLQADNYPNIEAINWFISNHQIQPIKTPMYYQCLKLNKEFEDVKLKTTQNHEEARQSGA
jgi:hypothetical protein